MPDNEYATFQEFETIADASKTAEILELNGIPVIIDKTQDLLDNNIIGRQYNNYIQLRIPATFFSKAQQILIDNTKIDLRDVDRNYMLFSLSNEELLDVLAKPDQWGAYNFQLARLILEEREKPVDSEELQSMQKEYIAGITEQRSINSTWLFFGYGFSILSLAAVFTNNIKALWLLHEFHMLPGFLGIILGIIIVTTKKTLPDGTRMRSYNAHARMHGWLMLIFADLVEGLILASNFWHHLPF